MADDFDPYYTWLGIRPEEQPADHYRLIGLRQFEDHADVISNALDQKMQFLRTLQVGKRSALSQKLLNEISAAGGCLLDKHKKLAYDKELKAKEAAKQAALKPAARPLPMPAPALPTAAPLPVAHAAAPRPLPAPARPISEPLVLGPKVEIAKHDAPSRPSASWMLPAMLGGGLLGLLLLVVVAVYASGLLSPVEKKIASHPAKNVPPVTPEKNVTKPSPEVTPGETNPPETTPERAPPESPESSPAKTPETSPGPKTTVPPPMTSSQTWWKDPGHVERLVALQIGTDAYAEFPDSASRSTLATPLTAELWLRLHLQGDKPVQILGTLLGGEGAVPKGWALFARRVGEGDNAKNQLYVEFWKPGGAFIRYDVTLPAGDWHHVALVVEPEKRDRIFIDGRSLELPAEKDLVSSQRNLVLGSPMQVAGASFKAEVCGLRVSESVRYSSNFTPPSPLEMKPDETTFAALDCRLYQSATPDKASSWLYGTGKLDPQSKKIVNFQPLRFGSARQWQGGPTRPYNKLGWAALDPIGGHPGNDSNHLVVRRWVAPAAGEVSVSGHLKHFHRMRAGDGVRASIVTSSTGSAGEWRVHFKEVETPAQGLKVQAGDTIDFVVDCDNNPACDTFEWIVDLKLVDPQQQLVGTWNSARDFRVTTAPADARPHLREPSRNKAQWVQMEDFGNIVFDREGPGESAQLIAQSVPATVNTPGPLTLKPAPVSTKPPSPFENLATEPPAPVAKKAPAPDAAALAKAKAEVMQVFGDDLKAAKAPKQKLELAQKMFDLVKDTNEPPTRFTLLEEVRRLAVEGRDITLATKAVEKLAEQFDVDLLAKKVKLFENLAAEGLTPAQRGEAISAACELGYEALDADKFEALQAIVSLTRSMVVKATTPESKTEAKEFFDASAKKQKLFEAIKKAEQTLTSAPNEPGASLTLGLYYCFVRGDQKKGLPLLAKGTDQKLAAAAKIREQNLAKGVASSLEEADAWFDAVATVSADYKFDVQKLALEGYKFLAASGTGLEKIKAEKRRDELTAAVAASPDKNRAKRIRANDLPEFSTGMVGRVLVNGKDAGVLLNFQPGRRMDYTPLNDILQKSKAAGLRVVLEGYISCTVSTEFYVYQSGQSGGPGQILSIRGNQVNAVGGATGRSSNGATVQLPAGEHLVQWAFDYAGTTSPRMDLSDINNGRPVVVRYTRQQLMAARKPTTNSEANLSY